MGFDLPTHQRIEANGIVVRALHGIEMGIVFADLSDEHRKAITDFVEQSA